MKTLGLIGIAFILFAEMCLVYKMGMEASMIEVITR